MAYTIEGMIEIPMEDWMEFLGKYRPQIGGDECIYGRPVNRIDYIEIPFAAASDGSPSDWAVPPRFMQEGKSWLS